MCQPFVPEMLIQAYPIHHRLVMLLLGNVPELSYILFGCLEKSETHYRHQTLIVVRTPTGESVEVVLDLKNRTLVLRCTELGALSNYKTIRGLLAKNFGLYVENSGARICKWSQIF